MLLFGPERVRETAPLVPEIGPTRDPLKLPVHTDQSSEIGLGAGGSPLLQHAHVPGAGIDGVFDGEDERTIAERVGRCFETGHG